MVECDRTEGSLADLGVHIKPRVGREGIDPIYVRYVSTFLKVINQTPAAPEAAEGRRKARMALWRLYLSHALPRCQFTAMCVYVHLCASLPIKQATARFFASRRDNALKQIKATADQLSKLRDALRLEAESARALFQSHEIDYLAQTILSLLASSLRRIEANINSRKDLSRLGGYFASRAIIMRRFRASMIDCSHPKGRRATAAELELLLPVLHEAITGAIPNPKNQKLYLSNNSYKHKSRLARGNTLAALNAVMSTSRNTPLSAEELIAVTNTLLDVWDIGVFDPASD